MTDRDGIEAAAKAAEIGAEDMRLLWLAYCAEAGRAVSARDVAALILIHQWNPLTDDGDALRLAVKLDIIPRWINGKAFAWADGVCEMIEPYGDKAAATRRAIVRAAAAMGAR